DRLPQYRSALYDGEPESESGGRRFDWQVRAAEEGDACAGRSRMAAGTEAVDCSDPGYDQAASTGREYRRGCYQTHARGSSAARYRNLKDRGARRPIPGRAAEISGALRQSCSRRGESKKFQAKSSDKEWAWQKGAML